jgi:hypothetical protein
MIHGDDTIEVFEHSHSTLRRWFDELDALWWAMTRSDPREALAPGETGFDWREEWLVCLDRLEGSLSPHFHYEENELFPRLRPHLDAEAIVHLEMAVEQHRGLERRLDRVRELVDTTLEPHGTSAGKLERLEVRLESLHDRFREHERLESDLFEAFETNVSPSSVDASSGSDSS